MPCLAFGNIEEKFLRDVIQQGLVFKTVIKGKVLRNITSCRFPLKTVMSSFCTGPVVKARVQREALDALVWPGF